MNDTEIFRPHNDCRHDVRALHPTSGKCLMCRLEATEDALKPFSHPDLCRRLGGNTEGDSRPVFGRDNALLTLGDFRKARAIFKDEA